MYNQKDHDVKHKRNDNLLKSLPTEVFSKARNTLVSISGALKPKNEQQQRLKKTDDKEKKSARLKSSRSEPEIGELTSNRHRSRMDEAPREHIAVGKKRPLSVGAARRYDDYLYYCDDEYTRESPHTRQTEPTANVWYIPRIVLPTNGKLNTDSQPQEVSERPRKKLSFREPEIVSSESGTYGRSHKLMGANSLTRRPTRISLCADIHSSMDGVDSDLDSQAMKIVRTVGQAFEVCHKMQNNTLENPVPSTSSAPDPPVGQVAKASSFNCGSSESGEASTSKAGSTEASAYGGKKEAVRPKQLSLSIPPPPKKEGKRTRPTAPDPTAKLPDLPECVGKVEAPFVPEIDCTTPLSAQHQLKLLREKLELQAQHTQVAVSQLHLVREQLAAEQAARCEAQARTHQLLLHNKELLEHIATLVAHLEQNEKEFVRPISAEHLTLLPQKGETMNDASKVETNGNRQQNNDDLIDLAPEKANTTHNENVENNNVASTFSPSLGRENAKEPNLVDMTNEQLQNYLVKKFKSLTFLNGQDDPNDNNNQQFYQNSRAFPDIPPISGHFSNSDLVSLLNSQIYKEGTESCDELSALAQAMSIAQSRNSLYSNSRDSSSSSKDSSSPDSSSEDGQPYIMPLSHAATLKATGEDGRVRLIVPVSPSESSSEVSDQKGGPTPSTSKQDVGNAKQSTAAPITRTTSEKAPNKSELMAAIRAQWTRHTTK